VNPAGADGLLAGNIDLLVIQTVSVIAAGAFAAAGTFVALYVTRLITPLRVNDDAESAGIDYSEHNERAYAPSWYQPSPTNGEAPAFAMKWDLLVGAPFCALTILIYASCTSAVGCSVWSAR